MKTVVTYGGLCLSWLLAFALVRTQIQPPAVLIDYLAGHENPIRFSLNPTDLSPPVMAQIEGARAVWLWTERGQTRGIVESVERNEQWKTYRGGLVLQITTPDTLAPGWVILSFQPLPAQRWHPIEAPPKDKADLATRLGREPSRLTLAPFETGDNHRYLVVDYSLPCPDGSSECGDFNDVETAVYRESAESGWERVDSFVDGGSTPFVDIDGDGIPEVIGSTGYKGYVLRRIIPRREKLVTSHSGV
jgi:hypothetical protein